MPWDSTCACRRPALQSRRAVMAGLAAVLPSSRLSAQTAAGTADDERFMRMAIAEARLADFPFGAVIVREGRVIARGRNLGRTNDDPTAHGEMTAILGLGRVPHFITSQEDTEARPAGGRQRHGAGEPARQRALR